MGSVSQYVVEHAPCAVVVVKEDNHKPTPKPEEKEKEQ